MTAGRAVLRAALLAAALALPPVRPAAAQLPPDARWWSFETEHFRIHFPDPALETVARRAAARAEVAYAQLAESFLAAPRGRIELVVADNVDFANGYATPLPTNRLVVFVHPPTDEVALAFFDDWLQLVIAHELTHNFHLDQAGGPWRALRRVFGRSALLFPQLLTPGWLIEGLAVYQESQLTRAGRLRGSYHEMALRAAVLEDAFFPIDRASGTPIRWPAGAGRYIYGSLFVAHLAERFGEERVTDFVRDYGARLVPYRLDAAARRTFGVSLSRAWREWQDSLRVVYTARADSLRAAGLTEPQILTPEGRFALYPRFAPDGASIVYAAATGRAEPSTRRVFLDDGRREEIAPRSTLGPVSWLPDGAALLSAELEFRDPYRLYAELVRLEPGGRRTQLTRGARLREPELHPDGRRLAAIGHAPGTNVPLVVDLRTGSARRLAEPSPDVHWAAPRWSPTGDRLALSRWRRGGYFDVVVLDTAGAVLRELTRDRAVDLHPAWSPDGRYLLFSSDRTGIANLFAYDLARDTLYQVTNLLTGGFYPDVSPDGRWIAYSHYSAAGFHIARLPFEPTSWRAAAPAGEEPAGGAPGAAAEAVIEAADEIGGPVRRYSAWPSVAPAGWLPQLAGGTALGTGWGAAVEGRDVIERHLWSADVLLYPKGGRLDARLRYRFRGWGVPLLDLSAAQEWDVAAESVAGLTPAGDTLQSALLRRERRAAISLPYLRPRWRSTAWIGGGPEVRHLEYAWDNPAFRTGVPLREYPLDLGVRLFGGYSTARAYGYSISPEDGVQLQFSAEARRYARAFAGEPAARGYGRLLGLVQGFQPVDHGGFARHVLALRLAGGYESGSVGPGFSAGGASSAGIPAIAGYGAGGTARSFPVRGYAAGAQRGDRALGATAEYRFPLALVERGVRTWPVFFDRLWGDVFLDAGTAWCTAACGERFLVAPSKLAPLASLGAEVALRSVLGYGTELTLRAGVALPLRDTPAGERPGAGFYLLTGRSF